MIRYAYQSQLQPPAPFVSVKVRNPATGVELGDLPAQLDTAADRTVLPDTIVKSLGLPQIGSIQIAGFGGVIHSFPVFAALVGIHDLAPQPVKVATHADEVWILLGRDVLNNRRIVLDGPQLALEFGA